MNAKVPQKKTEIDTSLLEQGIKNINHVKELITASQEDAKVMKDNCKNALTENPLDIDMQSQLLSLNDYIIKTTQNLYSLDSQLNELETQLEAGNRMKNVN